MALLLSLLLLPIANHTYISHGTDLLVERLEEAPHVLLELRVQHHVLGPGVPHL